jgi:hypothetical protein
MQGTLLVDADRSKAMIHATMDMNPISDSNFDMLIDFGEGYTLTNIPMLDTCQSDPLAATYQLHDLFASLQSNSSY